MGFSHFRRPDLWVDAHKTRFQCCCLTKNRIAHDEHGPLPVQHRAPSLYLCSHLISPQSKALESAKVANTATL